MTKAISSYPEWASECLWNSSSTCSSV